MILKSWKNASKSCTILVDTYFTITYFYQNTNSRTHFCNTIMCNYFFIINFTEKTFFQKSNFLVFSANIVFTKDFGFQKLMWNHVFHAIQTISRNFYYPHPIQFSFPEITVLLAQCGNYGNLLFGKNIVKVTFS